MTIKKNDYKHMKQDNEIDQIFRDASNVNLNEEIPSVFISDLNSRLDALEKKRKRPVAFWWLVGVFSLSIIIWGATLLFNSTNKTISAKTENVEEIKSTKSKRTTKSFTNQTKSKIANAKYYSIENNVENSLSYSSQVKNKRGAEEKKNGSNGLNKNDLAQIFIKTQSNIGSEQTSSIQSSEKAAIELNNELSKSNADIEMKNVEPIIEKEIVQAIDSTKVLDSIQKNQTVEKIALAKDKKKLSITKEIGFFTGVSGIISSFEIPSELENSITNTIAEYRETREREEIATTSWDFSLRMKWVIKNFSIQSGVDYFQWGEEIRYSYNSISGINRYGYLSIPLNLGYAKTWNKFGVNPFGGIMFGYGINRLGNYLQPDLNSIAQVESKKYLTNYQIGCEISFLSDSQFKFSLVPIYKASFKEVVSTDVIRNRYKSIGLQLGISYKF